jgi:hypothetical protein
LVRAERLVGIADDPGVANADSMPVVDDSARRVVKINLSKSR